MSLCTLLIYLKIQKIVPSIRSSRGYFGSTVALSGNYFISNGGSGNIFVFKKGAGGDDTWTEIQRIQNTKKQKILKLQNTKKKLTKKQKQAKHKKSKNNRKGTCQLFLQNFQMILQAKAE